VSDEFAARLIHARERRLAKLDAPVIIDHEAAE
jgi:hypothetical protein